MLCLASLRNKLLSLYRPGAKQVNDDELKLNFSVTYKIAVCFCTEAHFDMVHFKSHICGILDTKLGTVYSFSSQYIYDSQEVGDIWTQKFLENDLYFVSI